MILQELLREGFNSLILINFGSQMLLERRVASVADHLLLAISVKRRYLVLQLARPPCLVNAVATVSDLYSSCSSLTLPQLVALTQNRWLCDLAAGDRDAP